MTRRVRWFTRGVGAMAGLEGVAVVTDRDVLPVTAALRALQRRSGLEVTAFGSSGIYSDPQSSTRAYSVRLGQRGGSATSCILVIGPLEQPGKARNASA